MSAVVQTDKTVVVHAPSGTVLVGQVLGGGVVAADWYALANKPPVIAAGNNQQEARDAIALGTAATHNHEEYATAAQGALADSAIQAGAGLGALDAAANTKLAGIAAGATANDTNAQLRDRANHTGTQLMSTISDKQGKVLDDLTPLLVDDVDSTVEPKGYLVSDEGGLFDGAQLCTQQTPEGLVTQTIHVPILGKSCFRTKPVGGAWSDLTFTIAPFDVMNWHGKTTAEAANAVINADGTFSRSVSSDEFKTGIEPMLDEYADAIVQGAQPIYYRSTCDADPDDWSYWGISAEQLAEIDHRLVHWGRSTKEVPQPLGLPPKTVPDLDSPLKPVGVQYSRIVPALLNVVKRQGAAIAALEARVSALEGGAA